MTLRFWISKCFGCQKRKPLANGRRTARATVRPDLEWLEERVVPYATGYYLSPSQVNQAYDINGIVTGGGAGSGATVDLTVSSGQLTSPISLVAGGSDYLPNATIDLAVMGDGGVNGVVQATTNASGVVTAVQSSPVQGGSGYGSNTSGVGGSGVATATTGINATVNLTVSGGAITAVTLDAGGSGYPDSATFDLAVTGGGGANGVIAATTNASGIVTAVQTAPVQAGSGYSNTTGAATSPALLGAGQTIAIIDPGDDDALVNTGSANYDTSDLYWFDQLQGVPDPASFTVVGEQGTSGSRPTYPSGGNPVDSGETTLDVEWSHSMAPGANIVLLELQNFNNSDISTAITTGIPNVDSLLQSEGLDPVSAVSMSFSEGESSYEQSAAGSEVDGNFQGAGVSFVASSGDNGEPVGYPSASPNVLSVGATNLFLNADGSYSSETAWSNPATITDISGTTGGTITVTTATATGVAQGNYFAIENAAQTGYDYFNVASVLSDTEFTYVDNDNLGASIFSGGTVGLVEQNAGGSGGGASAYEAQPSYQQGPVTQTAVSQNISASPNGASESGNTVTITTTTAPDFLVGSLITIAGVTGSFGSYYDGTFTVVSENATSFTYTDAWSPLSNAGGGTATQGPFTQVAGGQSVSSASESGSTVTITTTSVPDCLAGNAITISGFSGAFAGYNGTFEVASVDLTTDSFTYTDSVSLLNPASGGTATLVSDSRTNPDVAFVGGVMSYVQVYDSSGAGGAFYTGYESGAAGTSLSAPCWAGLIAIADQGLALQGQPLLQTSTINGATLQTVLYDLPSTDYHDNINAGYNGYPAQNGYDLLTGLGSPVANLLIPDLANALVYVAPDTGATQNIDVEQNGSTIDVIVNGTTVASGPVSTTSEIDISGGASTGTISLTVDYSGGVFDTIPINFNGGTGGGSTSLTIAGSTTLTSLTYDATGPGVGDFVVNGASADKITFRNVNSLTDSATVGTVTLNVDPADVLSGTVNTTLTGSGSSTIASFSSNSLASLTFPNPTAALVVNDTRTANDAVTITSLGSGFNAALTVTASGGSGTVTVTPALNLGSASSSGDLAITAATINLNGGMITTNNGGADGSVTMTGAVTIGATLTVTAGTVTFGGTVDAAAAGEQGLAITGNASFAGPVGGADPLASLSVSGTTALNTPSVATTSTAGGTGDQTYSGAVSLEQAAITLTATTVTFAVTLDLGTDTLTVTGNLVLDATATLSSTLAGTDDYGQISCSGTAAIAGALSITQQAGFTPPNGFVFDILGVNSSGALSGTFTGRAEGSEVFGTGGSFVISYEGGSSGNDVVLTAPIVVNTTADPATAIPGTTSLREAIDLVNSTPGVNLITFDLPGGGAQTLAPTSALRWIAGTVIIDGTSEPGFASAPVVTLSGSSAGAGVYGLVLDGANCTLLGLIIENFTLGGVYVASNGNTIGGTAAGAGDIISTNTVEGVYMAGSANLIEGDRIGTNAAGSAALANSTGVLITGANNTVGGTAAAAGNVISGNSSSGIYLDGSAATGNLVEGNLIGTNAAGSAALANGTGVSITGSNNTVGGTTAAAANIISGNSSIGVYIAGSAGTGNLVEGNYVGTNTASGSGLGNSTGVLITGANNTVGGTAAGAGNIISGNSSSGIYLDGSTATGNLVEGNLIGTNAAGSAALANGTGVSITGSNNTVGGTTAAAANIIAGNSSIGVYIAGSAGTGNLVEGNYVGTNTASGSGLANSTGVLITGANNTVGGTAAGAGNVISGNSSNGIYLDGSAATGNLLEGNLIGTNAAGMPPWPTAPASQSLEPTTPWAAPPPPPPTLSPATPASGSTSPAVPEPVTWSKATTSAPTPPAAPAWATAPAS